MSPHRLAPDARVLITGGAGFIGSHLADHLVADGCRVTVLDDLSTGSFANIEHLVDRPGFEFAIDSIAAEGLLDRLVAECDVVVHLAAAVGVDLILDDPIRVLESNVFGVRTVLNAAVRYRKKVLVASSSEVYGKNDRVPLHEDDDRILGPTSRARWSYSASKAVGEYLALAYAERRELPVVIVRLFNTVGPRQSGRYGMVLPRFVAQALARQPLSVYGDGRQTRAFCDVRDAVRGLVGLAREPAAEGRVFNLGATREVSVLELAGRVIEVCGGGTIRLVPYDEAYAPGFEDMRRRVPDTGRIERLIGWRPEIELDRTIADVADALRPTPHGGPSSDQLDRPSRTRR